MMKKDLRNHIRQIRKTLVQSPQDDQKLIDLFFTHINPQAGQVIAAYEKMGSECNPAPIVSQARQYGLKVVMPLIQENSRVLSFGGVKPDIIITPLIAFDRKGWRLGQGGGYYDTTFASIKALKVGLAFAEQEVPDIPQEDHDQKLDWIITPKEAIEIK